MSEQHERKTRELVGNLVIESLKMLPVLVGFYVVAGLFAWVAMKFGWLGMLIFVPVVMLVQFWFAGRVTRTPKE